MKAFDEIVAHWAAGQPAIQAVVLIGSHVRPEGASNAADEVSDWDFQVITSAPGAFANAGALDGLIPARRPMTYSCRPAFGGIQRVTALYPEVEVDFVVINATKLRLAKLATALGAHRRPGSVRDGLSGLAVVIRPGYRFLKGEASWNGFYQKVIREVPDPRLDDAAIVALADGFVCDVVWSERKVRRGEYLAVQRMLHQSLAETNFLLLHERRLRQGKVSHPEARRIERVAEAKELAAVTMSATPGPDALAAAIQQVKATLIGLMRDLVPSWRWPEESFDFRIRSGLATKNAKSVVSRMNLT
ncbi:hypothetical protein MASR2M8_18570 [Opitutaceae bacterium]